METLHILIWSIQHDLRGCIIYSPMVLNNLSEMVDNQFAPGGEMIKYLIQWVTPQEGALADLNIRPHLGRELGTVTEAVSPLTKGRVKFQGTEWWCQSCTSLDSGEKVEVVDRIGLTLIVRPM